ncbi:MAG: ABC transporter ATP-binding protein [Chloroflexota bacterium]|nr:ABC transporter ATP-binding protein [Chloroflexota bacterium]
MPALLEVKNLKTHFKIRDGLVKAVDEVSFTINRGEILGVVGESGSGKSVTALSILRLIPTSPGQIVSGEVLFEGQDLLKLSDKEIRKIRGREIAMIFQDPMTSLNPVLTIGYQLSEPLMTHLHLTKDEARKESIELLKMVEIPNAAERIKGYPHHLSGGMRQRVMIAMALACRPKLIIADEPTTALDVTIQAQILELLNKLRTETGTAVMLITHALGVVAGMANRVQVMYAGHIVESATAEELFDNPRHPYTMGLLRSLPRLDETRQERLVPIKGSPPDLLELNQGCSFHPRCDYTFETCPEKSPWLRRVATKNQLGIYDGVNFASASLPLQAAKVTPSEDDYEQHLIACHVEIMRDDLAPSEVVVA